MPVDGPALMVFEQSAAAGPWQLASVAQFPAGTTLAPAVDGQERLHPAGAADLDRPARAALRHRPAAGGRGRRRPGQRRRQGGGGRPADHRPVPGRARPLPGGGRPRVTGLQVPAGDVYQWSMEGTPYPAFALRTADGGALVLYAMYLNSTVAVPGYFNKASPIEPGAPDRGPAGPAPPPPVRPAKPPGKARGPGPLLLRRHRPPGRLSQDHGPSHRRRPQLRHRLLTLPP